MKRPFLTISRDQVLNKYWELANLDAESTKGSITGQLKALDSLCQELASPSGERSAQSVRPEGMYRPAWLIQAGDES